jgi:hypothetical protein
LDSHNKTFLARFVDYQQGAEPSLKQDEEGPKSDLTGADANLDKKYRTIEKDLGLSVAAASFSELAIHAVVGAVKDTLDAPMWDKVKEVIGPMCSTLSTATVHSTFHAARAKANVRLMRRHLRLKSMPYQPFREVLQTLPLDDEEIFPGKNTHVKELVNSVTEQRVYDTSLEIVTGSAKQAKQDDPAKATKARAKKARARQRKADEKLSADQSQHATQPSGAGGGSYDDRKHFKNAGRGRGAQRGRGQPKHLGRRFVKQQASGDLGVSRDIEPGKSG